jgi:ribosomal-protein-alanine N-acetyltransferase
MNAALLQPEARIEPMTVAHLDAVTSIESQAYGFPWSRGNFIDSLAAGYFAQVLLDAQRGVVGYFVAMRGVDEMHLLNITITPTQWGRGLARRLLDHLVASMREAGLSALWLEVRESNLRARRIYERYGFAQVGVRRGYYPAPHGTREDAVLMSLRIDQGACGGVD